MKGLVKYCIVINILLLSAGCSRSPYRRQFADLQPLLEQSQKVDSCLQVLQGIDTTRLVRNADKARFSLLYAMALDKNYIDTTDLSVLKPAIDRYLKRRHLCRRDKFYTWYYRGRIEGNGGFFDLSLSSFLMAERFSSAINDVYRARLYFAFEWVYNELLSFKEALSSAQEALYYAERSGDSLEYSSALLECALQSSLSARPSLAKKYIEKYESEFGFGHGPRRGDYYKVKMIYCSNGAQNPSDSSVYYLRRYLNSGQEIYHIPCALTCIANGLFDESDAILDDFVNSGGSINSAYYYCRSRSLEAKGDYQGALNYLHKQESLINRDYLHNLNEDISYQAEKYHAALAKSNRRLFVWTGLFSIVVVLFILLMITRRKQYEHRLLKHSLEDIRREYELSKRIYSQIKYGSSHADNIDKVVSRILELSGWFAYSKTLMQACEILVGKFETKEFEGLVAMLGSIHCKNFCDYLRSKGLNTFEIAYCILMLKLSTKELEFLFKRRNLYNVNNTVKNRIGAENKLRLNQILINQYFVLNNNKR